MKLRNKKTGEIIEGNCFTDIVKKLHERGDVLCYGSLLNVDLFKEYWEEIDSYEPREPLIKDEKIRKAVRAWAEVNKIDKCECKEEMHCVTFETERGMFISFENACPIPPEGNYTIKELCGE